MWKRRDFFLTSQLLYTAIISVFVVDLACYRRKKSFSHIYQVAFVCCAVCYDCYCLTVTRLWHFTESLTAEAPITSHFSMATSLQTMGCFLNKVASSSLVSAFLQTYGLGPSFKSPHSLAFKLMPRVGYWFSRFFWCFCFVFVRARRFFRRYRHFWSYRASAMYLST